MPEFSTRVVGEVLEIVNLELQNPTTVNCTTSSSTTKVLVLCMLQRPKLVKLKEIVKLKVNYFRLFHAVTYSQAHVCVWNTTQSKTKIKKWHCTNYTKNMLIASNCGKNHTGQCKMKSTQNRIKWLVSESLSPVKCICLGVKWQQRCWASTELCAGVGLVEVLIIFQGLTVK